MKPRKLTKKQWLEQARVAVAAGKETPCKDMGCDRCPHKAKGKQICSSLLPESEFIAGRAMDKWRAMSWIIYERENFGKKLKLL
jgi:hypothetical protein